MKNLFLLVLLVCSGGTYAQQRGQSDAKVVNPPQAMCRAAASKLLESGTNDVVLTITVDSRGKVESFLTDAPKGLRLEKIKEAATAIKALKGWSRC
jgi:hypothetical protein